MGWKDQTIIDELRRLHKSGTNLSYNAMTRKHQKLLSAAAYHFGSYRRAVQRAGIDYSEVLRRPRWSREIIVKLIRDAKKRGRALNWWAVTRKRDELARAAFASLQDRLFGGWESALRAAGVDAAAIHLYRRWTPDAIKRALKRKPKNSGAMQQADPGLHAAAVRYFKSYDAALRAAGLQPSRVRKRNSWDKPLVIRRLRAAKQKGVDLSSTSLRHEDTALYGAAIRLFGGLPAARAAAGIRSR